jgi:hypothetical protein
MACATHFQSLRLLYNTVIFRKAQPLDCYSPYPCRWNAVEDLEHVRFTDDVAPVARVSIAQVCCQPHWFRFTRFPRCCIFCPVIQADHSLNLTTVPVVVLSQMCTLDPNVNDPTPHVSACSGGARPAQGRAIAPTAGPGTLFRYPTLRAGERVLRGAAPSGEPRAPAPRGRLAGRHCGARHLCLPQCDQSSRCSAVVFGR